MDLMEMKPIHTILQVLQFTYIHFNTSDPNSPVAQVNHDAPYVDPDPGHSITGIIEFSAIDNLHLNTRLYFM